MPIPAPTPSEKQNDFVSRCIQALKNEDSNRSDEQIQAMCFSAWREQKKASLEYVTCLHRLEAKDGRNLATFYLMNTSRNRNRWGVSDKALIEALPTIANAPLGLDSGYQGINHPANPINVGKFIRFEKPNGYCTATADIDDPKAWELLKTRKLGPISVVINGYHATCSKCGSELKSQIEAQEHPCIKAGDGYQLVQSFKFDRVDFVDRPAYPQAGILNIGAHAEGVMNPIQLCASAYESQFQNDGSIGTAGTNPENRTREGKKLEKTKEELQAELDKATKDMQTLKAELAELKKTPEKPAEVAELKAELKQAKDDLDAIKKAKHEDLLTVAVDKRFEAGLIAKKEDERKRIAEFPDEMLKMLASDAEAVTARLKASLSAGPRTRYSGSKEEGSELADAVLKQAAALGLDPTTLYSFKKEAS